MSRVETERFRIRFGCLFTRKSVGALMVVLFLTACTPPTEQEQQYLEEREAAAKAQEGVSKALRGATRQSEAMAMVKSQDAPDGRGTIEEWIDRKISTTGSTVMFPRWKVKPKGGEKFEVQFVYSVMEQGYSMKKLGYGWDVDLVLKIVSPHHELSEDELTGGRSSRGEVSQQQRKEKRRQEVFSLE